MVHFNTISEIEDFIERAGGVVSFPPYRKHSLIMSKYIKEPVGCCWNRLDVLFEDQDATFKECNPKECPICHGE
jgi:hypothetical protein